MIYEFGNSLKLVMGNLKFSLFTFTHTNVYFTPKVYRYFNPKVYHFNIKSKLVLSFLEVPPKRIKRALLFW